MNAGAATLFDVLEPIADVAVAKPAPALRGAIENYVGYRYVGFQPGLHRGLPSRQLTFIISLDEPVEMAELPNPQQPSATMAAFVAGLAPAPALIRHDGTQYGIEIELTPLGARTLFGLPARDLAWYVVALDDLLSSSADELLDRVATAPEWSHRFGILDEVLLREIRETRLPSPEVVHAWNCLVASEGGIEVHTLAREVGWSRRHLGERFRDEFGVTPKVMGRVMRFEQARRLLQTPAHPSLADVAAMCGYYDQAHMTREWNELAGCTPTVWMAEDLPSVQDTLVTATAS